MQQCGEALWLTPGALVAGGCVSNVFGVKNGDLFTPTAQGEEVDDEEPSAVLPGITRQVIMDIAHDLGVDTNKKQVSFDELLDADEIFLTNSSWGVLPVIGVRAMIQTQEGGGTQDQPICAGEVGQLTKQLHVSYQDTVDRETSATLG
jgi:branched-subunit amino acid aminotransferase/4-amino-4-deoxychorismate lyase